MTQGLICRAIVVALLMISISRDGTAPTRSMDGQPALTKADRVNFCCLPGDQIAQGKKSPQGVVAWDVEVTNQLGELVASYDIPALIVKRED